MKTKLEHPWYSIVFLPHIMNNCEPYSASQLHLDQRLNVAMETKLVICHKVKVCIFFIYDQNG